MPSLERNLFYNFLPKFNFIMKKLNLILVMLVVAGVFTACCNVEKVLPKKEGDWKVTNATTSVFVDGQAQTTDSTSTPDEDVIYHFDEGGTGSYQEGSQSSDFAWSYNKDTEQITITQDGFAQVYDVLDCGKKAMQLFFTFEIEFFGITTRTETTFDMERQ